MHFVIIGGGWGPIIGGIYTPHPPRFGTAECDLIFHSTCLTNYTIFSINKHDILRYNPFYSINRSDDQYDRFYDNNITDFTDTFDNACQVLEECQQFSTADVSSLLKTKTASIRNSNSNINNEINNAENHEAFSHLFYNIDGNETKSIDYDFSVIGLAGTNTEKVDKDIYRIDGYTSCYQSPKDSKQKRYRYLPVCT